MRERPAGCPHSVGRRPITHDVVKSSAHRREAKWRDRYEATLLDGSDPLVARTDVLFVYLAGMAPSVALGAAAAPAGAKSKPLSVACRVAPQVRKVERSSGAFLP